MKYCNVLEEIEKVPTIKFLSDEENWYGVRHCVYAVFRIVKSAGAYYAYIAYGLGVDADYVKNGDTNYLYVKEKMALNVLVGKITIKSEFLIQKKF